MAIKVYDAKGNERDLKWAMEKYNIEFIFVPGDVDHWEVVALHEQIGNTSMTVRLVGDDVDEIPIAFYWREAPYESLPEEPKPRHVAQLTDKEGQVGFGMGGGAYYRPDEGQYGPHAVWVAMYPDHTSDCVDGLGMVGRTFHAHLEPTFQFVRGEEEPEPAPQPECEALRQAAIEARDILEAALGS